jgi:anaerobic selenocysteine-containing dehydrogenase
MIIPRREFLKMLGVAAGTASLGGCGRLWGVPDHWVQEALRGPGLESSLQTVCGLCEAGCGVTVRLVDGIPVGLRGNANHPLNRGGLCPVGQAGLEVLYAPDRIRGPRRRLSGGGFEDVSWEGALGEIGDRLASLIEAGEGDRVALMTEEPGQLFYDMAQRFSQSLGSSSCIQLGRLSTLSYELTQGVDEVPGFDLAQTDLVLSFGLDLFEDGPAPLQAISSMIGSRSTEARASLLQVGTRMSPSAAKAGEFVGIEPGSHGAFALGVAHVLVREANYDSGFVQEHTFGFEDWTDAEGESHTGFRRLVLEHYYPDRVAQLCGCEPARIVSIARRFAAASSPCAVSGGEAVIGSNATWTGMAVHALNALLGAFDRPGGIVLPPPIPLTPMPPIATAPSAPTVSMFHDGDGSGFGADPLESFAERLLETPDEVDVLILINTNPVFSHPAGGRLRKILEQIPLVVAVAPFEDETAAAADYILPSHVYLEKWQGMTTPQGVAFSTLGVGQPAIEPLYDTRDPGDVLLTLAKHVGGPVAEALPWSSYEEYLRFRLEGLVISGEGSVVSGSFEESWVHFLEERGWRFLEQKTIEDFWADLLRESGWWNPVQSRGDWQRIFPTPSGKFEFSSQKLEQRLVEAGRAGGGDEMPLRQAMELGRTSLGLAADIDEICLPHFETPRWEGEGELVLVPFRPITARGDLGSVSPMLMEMYGYPLMTEWQTWVELAPETAHELDLGDGDEVAVESDGSSIEAVVRIQPGSTPGVAHVPLGLGHRQSFGAGGGLGGNPMEVLSKSHDSLTGSRSLATTRVRLRLIRRRPHGGPAPLFGEHA